MQRDHEELYTAGSCTDDDGRKIGRITTVNKGKHGGKDHWAYSERGVPLETSSRA